MKHTSLLVLGLAIVLLLVCLVVGVGAWWIVSNDVMPTAVALAPTVPAATLTPTPTSTRTPEPTLAQTSTPGPDWQLLLREDYEIQTTRANWFVGEEKNATYTAKLAVRDGTYQIDVTSERDFIDWSIPQLQSVTDFDLQLRMGESTGNPAAQQAVAFRLIDADNFYAIALDSSGHLLFAKSKAGKWEYPHDWEPIPNWNQKSLNTVRVAGEGTKFAVWVNDEFLYEVEDNTFSEGRIALGYSLTRPGETAHFEFDDFSLYIVRNTDIRALTATRMAVAPTLQAVDRWITVSDNRFDTVLGSYPWVFGATKSKFGSLDIGLDQNAYRWEMDTSEGVTWWRMGTLQPIEQFDLSVRAEPLSATRGMNYGLVFGFQNSDNFYSFEMVDELIATLVRRENGEWKSVMYWDAPPGFRRGNQNDLRILHSGDQYSFFINGHLVGSFQDSQLASGLVGLMAGLQVPDSKGTIRFDDFRLAVPFIPTMTPRPRSPVPAARATRLPTRLSSPTPIPSGGIIFEGNFLRGRSNWELVPSKDQPKLSSTYFGGYYSWIGAATDRPATWVMLAPIGDVTPGSLEADTRLGFGSPGSDYGIVFEYTDEQNYSRFVVNGAGESRVERLIAGTWETLLHALPTTLNGQENTHRLKTEHSPEEIIFFVDDVKIGSTPNSGPGSGRVGLTLILESGENAAARFGSFVVRKP